MRSKRGFSPARRTKLMTLMPSTGNTHGMRLRISPPMKANSSASQRLRSLTADLDETAGETSAAGGRTNDDNLALSGMVAAAASIFTGGWPGSAPIRIALPVKLPHPPGDTRTPDNGFKSEGSGSASGTVRT